jgi:anthranilate synthase component I
MEFTPSLSEFRSLARGARVVPVCGEFLFDVDTAVTAYHKLYRPPFGFLLESVVGGETWARYTFLGTAPSAAWRLQGDRVSWWTPEAGWSPVEAEDPLGDLDRRLRERVPAQVPGLPRFWGGAVGYFGYDVVRQVEHLPDPPPDDLGLPDALVVFTDVVLAIDNLRGRATAIASVQVEDPMDEAALDALPGGPGADPWHRGPAPGGSSAPSPHPAGRARGGSPLPEHLPPDRVRGGGGADPGVHPGRRCLPGGAEPAPGDGAPSPSLRPVPGPPDPQPVPYLFFLEMDGVTLVGSSPEVLTRVEEGRVTVRPIAGTRPRGATPAEDRALEEDLRQDEKELAEHRMLVDLGRNDVGRVARYGTVTVPELMVVERYSHVMHLVSQVEGELREGLSAWTSSGPPSPPEPFPGRRRSGPWRSSTSWSRCGGAPTPGRWATWGTGVTPWTRPSPSAPCWWRGEGLRPGRGGGRGGLGPGAGVRGDAEQGPGPPPGGGHGGRGGLRRRGLGGASLG